MPTATDQADVTDITMHFPYQRMRRLLASGLLPQRAGQPVALVHVSFADLRQMDQGSVLQDKWNADYRAQWAAHRAAASVDPGDGGAWLEDDAARAVVRDAMIIPVVTSDIAPAAVEELIGLCVEYDRIRAHAQGRTADAGPEADIDGIGWADAQAAGDPHDSAAAGAGPSAEVLATLEHQILGTIIRVMSGPRGVASFLRRNLLGRT